ncbi:hypothetical protein LO762_17515 [Actinocorallia sp. API 0066]|uniref:hypothetical protein n=1 Tax=Actinocorallia sp. API 0066 TaxID=2896846 RepID=UPI001E51E886|nr:hypothetical protein [Actinocorallia sp. API 0066]MCD0450980.1 hypothetical protein [Actinocorallia sp. API 0066]
MSRLSRNEIEEGTQSDRRRSARNRQRQQPHSAQAKTGRHAAAKKSLPLRRGQGR